MSESTDVSKEQFAAQSESAKLGAKTRDILTQFSGALSIAGGFIGTVFGMGASLLISRLGTGRQRWFGCGVACSVLLCFGGYRLWLTIWRERLRIWIRW